MGEVLRLVDRGGAAPEEADVGGSSKPKYFKGTGYKLGSEEDPSEVIATDQPDESETELEPVCNLQCNIITFSQRHLHPFIR